MLSLNQQNSEQAKKTKFVIFELDKSNVALPRKMYRSGFCDITDQKLKVQQTLEEDNKKRKDTPSK